MDIDSRVRSRFRCLAAVIGCWMAVANPAQTMAAPGVPAIVDLGGILNAESDDTPTFTPDGDTVFFDRSTGSNKFVMIAHRINGHWAAPDMAPFSGRWYDQNPVISPDGSFLIFNSDRPIPGTDKPLVQTFFGKPNPGSHLWRVDRKTHGWGEPVWLGATLNDSAFIDFPSIASDGSLYFLRRDQGAVHIFRSQYAGGKYLQAQRVPLGDPAESTHDPAVAPDESFIIFDYGKVKNGLGRLCIAFREGDHWGKPMDFGDDINRDIPWGAHLSADHRTVYFTGASHIWSLSLAPWLPGGAVHADSSAEAPKAMFKGGTSSSGWIDFKPYKASGIFFPARVNGREAMVFLYGGPTHIDKGFAAALGLPLKPGAGAEAPESAAVTVEIGAMTLSNLEAAAIDAPPQFAKITGRPVPFHLGEEAFNRVAVDIDYAHHRLAFRDPDRLAKPAGAREVPVVELDGERTVPLSINGAPPVQFELELGNVSGPLLVVPSYVQAHKLLEGRRTSQRLSGKFIEPVVTLDRLSFAGVDFPEAPIALVPDAALPPASITGGVGLPLLSHFRLLIDYSHHRLFAIPNAGAAQIPFEKDRLGLVVAKQGDELGVTFVAPGSPAEAAGFAAGEKIAAIDGKPAALYPDLAVMTLRFADSGSRFAFTMKDGAVRQVEARNFF